MSDTTPNTPEDVRTEYKTASEGRLPDDIWKTISAFSNTDGGTIYLGITPDIQPVGLTADNLDKLQTDITSLCSFSFNVAIQPEITCYDGYLAVVIQPSPAAVRPVYKKSLGINRGSYIRVGSSNIQADGEQIKRFAIAARGGAETLSSEVDYSTCLDRAKITAYIEKLNSRGKYVYQNFSYDEIVHKQRFADANNKATLLGLLAFSKDLALQEVIAPTINIAVTQYPGTTKVDSLDLNQTYSDDREFNGDILTQYINTLDFVKSRLPITGIISNGIRTDYYVIPEVALREAIANAIVHRDYSVTSSRIQIDIYSDRIEITNPGRSLVPIDQLETAQSATRNPLLMSFLRENGVVDQKARGIRTIRLAAKNAGLTQPKFENIAESFRVTLFRPAFLSSDDTTWLKQFDAHTLSESQKNCLIHLRHNSNGISNSEYCDLNNMTRKRDDKRANHELTTMVALGILRAEGNTRNRRYYLSTVWQ